jgi:hypothetical protein
MGIQVTGAGRASACIATLIVAALPMAPALTG